MGYLGYFYVETKSFKIRSEFGNGGVPLTKWSRGIFRSVVMAIQSIVWLLNTMEELIKGDTSKDLYRTYRIEYSVPGTLRIQ
jgi:hypothetical protein